MDAPGNTLVECEPRESHPMVVPGGKGPVYSIQVSRVGSKEIELLQNLRRLFLWHIMDLEELPIVSHSEVNYLAS